MFHTPLNQVNTFEPSYAVTNARVGYTIPKSDVRVAVYVNNLFDKNYALNRSYVAFADYNTANFARPREWGVSLAVDRPEEHTSELQSLMRISYAVFCLKKKTHQQYATHT